MAGNYHTEKFKPYNPIKQKNPQSKSNSIDIFNQFVKG